MLWSYDKDLIQKEVEALPAFFTEYLPASFIPRNALSFCCGIANEEPVLKDLFPELNLLSIDTDVQMEDMAKDLGRTSFKNHSVERLSFLEFSSFDLYLGRNLAMYPDIDLDFEKDMWPDVFYRLQQHMTLDSYLLLTFAREDEFRKGTYLLNSNNYQILRAEENSVFIPSDRIGIAGADVKDNYVLLTKK